MQEVNLDPRIINPVLDAAQIPVKATRSCPRRAALGYPLQSAQSLAVHLTFLCGDLSADPLLAGASEVVAGDLFGNVYLVTVTQHIDQLVVIAKGLAHDVHYLVIDKQLGADGLFHHFVHIGYGTWQASFWLWSRRDAYRAMAIGQSAPFPNALTCSIFGRVLGSA